MRFEGPTQGQEKHTDCKWQEARSQELSLRSQVRKLKDQAESEDKLDLVAKGSSQELGWGRGCVRKLKGQNAESKGELGQAVIRLGTVPVQTQTMRDSKAVCGKVMLFCPVTLSSGSEFYMGGSKGPADHGWPLQGQGVSRWLDSAGDLQPPVSKLSGQLGDWQRRVNGWSWQAADKVLGSGAQMWGGWEQQSHGMRVRPRPCTAPQPWATFHAVQEVGAKCYFPSLILYWSLELGRLQCWEGLVMNSFVQSFPWQWSPLLILPLWSSPTLAQPVVGNTTWKCSLHPIFTTLTGLSMCFTAWMLGQ